jgi:hypothetical protein
MVLSGSGKVQSGGLEVFRINFLAFSALRSEFPNDNGAGGLLPNFF